MEQEQAYQQEMIKAQDNLKSSRSKLSSKSNQDCRWLVRLDIRQNFSFRVFDKWNSLPTIVKSLFLNIESESTYYVCIMQLSITLYKYKYKYRLKHLRSLGMTVVNSFKSPHFLHTMEGSIGAFFSKNFFWFQLSLNLQSPFQLQKNGVSQCHCGLKAG